MMESQETLVEERHPCYPRVGGWVELSCQKDVCGSDVLPEVNYKNETTEQQGWYQQWGGRDQRLI